MPRSFPVPDPMIACIDPEDGPYAFWRLPHQERALRLRYYLVALCAGHHEMVAWHLAMDTTPTAMDELWSIVDLWPDARLLRAIADATRLRELDLPPRPVFQG